MTAQEIQDIIMQLRAASTDIRQLNEPASPSGLFTIGVDSANNAFRVPLDAAFNPSDKRRLDQLEAAIRVYGLPFQYSLTMDDIHWNLININRAGYVKYLTSPTSSGYPLQSTQDGTDAFLWGFVGNPYSGFTVVNKAAGTSLALSLSTYSNGQAPLMETNSFPTQWFVEKSLKSGYEGHISVFTVDQNGNKWFWNNFGGNGFLSTYYNAASKDNGSNILVTPI